MRRFAAPLLVALALTAAPAPAGAAGDGVVWTTDDDGSGDVRFARFTVADADCAYTTMADPEAMDRALEHLEAVDVHADTGRFQDVTLTERFAFVGLVQSRYHRNIDGSTRLEWKLITGKQRRHDGYWQVTAREDGRGDVAFRNTIEAKSILHQPLLRGIQTRTMSAIVDSVQRTCAAY